jgi:hypothetical protein
MEHYSVTRTDNGLHIEGFPDGIKVIALDNPKARRISDLLLHKQDLEFADQCLDEINNVGDESRTIQEALWRSAIIHYCKCFGNSVSRFQLSRDKIYKREPPEAEIVYRYFQDLRDKHVVHDENAYSQSIPGAILNDGTKEYKIEKIVCFGARANTLDQTNYANLKLLIQKATTWVDAQFETCCELVTKELEAVPYNKLLQKEQLNYQAPTVEAISASRGVKS